MAAPDYTRRAARALLGAAAHPGGRALTARLLDLADVRGGSQVADVGCGSGAAARPVRRRGARLCGLDIEARAVRRARRRGVEAVIGDAHALPWRDASYDVVVCECALSTCADPAGALREMARVLCPGGRLALSDVTMTAAAPDDAGSALRRLTSPRPLGGYLSLLSDAGFEVLVTEDRRSDAAALVRRLRRRLPWVKVLRSCAAAVDSGTLSYVVLVAVRRG